jgi:hypothetical protein
LVFLSLKFVNYFSSLVTYAIVSTHSLWISRKGKKKCM